MFHNDPAHDWSAFTLDGMEEADRLSGAGWLKEQQGGAQYQQREPEPFDAELLQGKQRQAFDMVMAHHRRSGSAEPVHTIVSGTAGTGKSCLLRALKPLLGSAMVLTATTGIAAYLICGCTVHKAVRLPVQERGHGPLTGANLATLQDRFRGVK